VYLIVPPKSNMAWRVLLLLYQFLHLAITGICLASSLEFMVRTFKVTVT